MGETGRVTDAIPTPHIALNDGHRIPQFGLGVWQIDDAEAERVVRPRSLEAFRLQNAHAMGRTSQR